MAINQRLDESRIVVLIPSCIYMDKNLCDTPKTEMNRLPYHFFHAHKFSLFSLSLSIMSWYYMGK